MTNAILDTDGENKALRCFLLHYQNPDVTVGAMKLALKRSGFDGAWPEFVEKHAEDSSHLTKGGAQLWIRHLMSLEDVVERIIQNPRCNGRRSIDVLLQVNNDWLDRTEWVQQRKKWPFNHLGMHRADIMTKHIEHLESEAAKRKPIIICWTVKREIGITDHYQVFLPSEGEDYQLNAKARYEAIRQKANTYSANLCVVTDSTDYFDEDEDGQ